MKKKNKKTIISASANIASKLKILAKEKESVRRRLVVTAKTLATKAKQLAVIAKEKESVRRRLEVTVEELKRSRAALEKKVIERTKNLDQAKAKDEAILESIGEGMIAVDNDGKIMIINKIAVDLLGWKAEALIGKIITDLPLEDEAGNPIPFNKRPTTIALAAGENTRVTYFFVKKDKTRFPIAITATPIKFGQKTIGLIEIIRDITKEKQIDKAKTEFVSLASHQLRTPLTAISWYTEMILNGDAGSFSALQKKYLEEIYHGNQRMIELVDNLLDVSRLELGTLKVEPKPTDIVALAESVLNEQKPKIKQKKLIVVENFSKDIPITSSDPKLLRMVFQNLLNNAVAYTPEGGKIEFTISLQGDQTILVKISDTGCGIPKNQQNQIFTKLFRADNVREKGMNGTGLGLYIVKSVVENSGGKIWFESEENKGTTFYVTLPLEGAKKTKNTK